MRATGARVNLAPKRSAGANRVTHGAADESRTAPDQPRKIKTNMRRLPHYRTTSPLCWRSSGNRQAAASSRIEAGQTALAAVKFLYAAYGDFFVTPSDSSTPKSSPPPMSISSYIITHCRLYVVRSE